MPHGALPARPSWRARLPAAALSCGTWHNLLSSLLLCTVLLRSAGSSAFPAISTGHDLPPSPLPRSLLLGPPPFLPIPWDVTPPPLSLLPLSLSHQQARCDCKCRNCLNYDILAPLNATCSILSVVLHKVLKSCAVCLKVSC